jgi:hypothetical protein
VAEILRTDGRFYPAFKKHQLYDKMLDELGIGPAPILEEDDTASLEESYEELETVSLCQGKNSTNDFEENGKIGDSRFQIYVYF